MQHRHRERHVTERMGWLRAAVLGANDGIVSTASLVMGVAAAHAAQSSILVAGTAGLVAGAMTWPARARSLKRMWRASTRSSRRSTFDEAWTPNWLERSPTN